MIACAEWADVVGALGFFAVFGVVVVWVVKR